MIQSLIVYLGITFFMVSCAYEAKIYQHSSIKDHKILYYGFLILIVLSFGTIFGARYDVGIDYLSYLSIFEDYGKGKEIRDSFEPGFVLINKFLSKNNIHYFFYFALIASVQMTFIVMSFKSNPQLLLFILITLMCGPFTGWMNIMRQEVVVCVFIWLIVTIDKRSFLNYLIWILICTFCFHKSAIILIPLYFIIKNRKNYTPPLIYQLAIYIFCVLLGFTHFIASYLNGLETIVSILGYEDQYGSIDDFAVFLKDDFNFGIRSWILAIITFFTILYSEKVKKEFTNKYVISLYNFFYWGSCFYFITYGIDVISRIFTYFSGISFVLYGITFYYCWITRNCNLKHKYQLILYAFLNLTVLASTFYSISLPDNHTEFKFFFQI